VQADAQPDVAVLADARAPAALKARLRDALARLPIKIALRD
jgi:fatty-acyl-CoA synthase